MFCNRWHRQIESCAGINQYVLFIQLSFSGDTWLPATNHIWTGSLNTELNKSHLSYETYWSIFQAGSRKEVQTKENCSLPYIACQLVCKQTILTEEKKTLVNFRCESLVWKLIRKGNRCFQVHPMHVSHLIFHASPWVCCARFYGSCTFFIAVFAFFAPFEACMNGEFICSVFCFK